MNERIEHFLYSLAQTFTRLRFGPRGTRTRGRKLQGHNPLHVAAATARLVEYQALKAAFARRLGRLTEQHRRAQARWSARLKDLHDATEERDHRKEVADQLQQSFQEVDPHRGYPGHHRRAQSTLLWVARAAELGVGFVVADALGFSLDFNLREEPLLESFRRLLTAVGVAVGVALGLVVLGESLGRAYKLRKLALHAAEHDLDRVRNDPDLSDYGVDRFVRMVKLAALAAGLAGVALARAEVANLTAVAGGGGGSTEAGLTAAFLGVLPVSVGFAIGFRTTNPEVERVEVAQAAVERAQRRLVAARRREALARGYVDGLAAVLQGERIACEALLAATAGSGTVAVYDAADDAATAAQVIEGVAAHEEPGPVSAATVPEFGTILETEKLPEQGAAAAGDVGPNSPPDDPPGQSRQGNLAGRDPGEGGSEPSGPEGSPVTPTPTRPGGGTPSRLTPVAQDRGIA